MRNMKNNSTRKFSIYLDKTFKYFSNRSEFKYLVTGSSSTIGSALIPKMINKYGEDNVILSEETRRGNPYPQGIFERLDVTDVAHFKYLMEKHQITHLVHLASVQSAFGEKNPYLAMKMNFEGVINALDMAREYNSKIFIPSSIAVFGPDNDKTNVEISVALSPLTIYGVSKHFMENMGNYYALKHNVDFRSIRYPGIISPHETEYQGSSDYASEIFFSAIKGRDYTIPLNPNRVIPFVYLDDIVDGTLSLMEADFNILTTKVYNVQAVSFSCEEIAALIKRKFANFEYKYFPDFRDDIAKTWPESLNDDAAKSDWKWSPKYRRLEDIVEVMTESFKINKYL